MKGPAATSPLEVSDQALARQLLQAAVSGELRLFGTRALSVGEWAALRGEKLYRTSRRVKHWLDLGVLEACSVTPRAGRAVVRYRLRQGEYYLPASILPLEEILAAVTDPLHEHFKRQTARCLVDFAPRAGTQVSLSLPAYGAYLATAPGVLFDECAPGSPALSESWAELALDHSAACALRDELAALLRKYAGQGGAGRYLVSLRMTPEVNSG